MAVDIQYYSGLYVGDDITGKQLDKIKKRLAEKPGKAGVFVIALSRNGVDQLDIYKSTMLAWPYYRKNPPFIIGIAGSYDASVRIVEKLAQECYRARGDCALKEYLLC